MTTMLGSHSKTSQQAAQGREHAGALQNAAPFQFQCKVCPSLISPLLEPCPESRLTAGELNMYHQGPEEPSRLTGVLCPKTAGQPFSTGSTQNLAALSFKEQSASSLSTAS